MMSRAQIRRVIDERLGSWGRHLAERSATPALLLGIQHPGGRVVVEAVEDLDDDRIEALLRHVLAAMAGGDVERDGPLEECRRGKRLGDMDEVELRETMIRVLRETADRLERQEDVAR